MASVIVNDGVVFDDENDIAEAISQLKEENHSIGNEGHNYLFQEGMASENIVQNQGISCNFKADVAEATSWEEEDNQSNSNKEHHYLFHEGVTVKKIVQNQGIYLLWCQRWYGWAYFLTIGGKQEF